MLMALMPVLPELNKGNCCLGCRIPTITPDSKLSGAANGFGSSVFPSPTIVRSMAIMIITDHIITSITVNTLILTILHLFQISERPKKLFGTAVLFVCVAVDTSTLHKTTFATVPSSLFPCGIKSTSIKECGMKSTYYDWSPKIKTTKQNTQPLHSNLQKHLC